MNLPFTPNEGSRPSRLALARATMGEIPPLPGPEAQAYAQELAAAQEQLAPFDWEVLRAASHRVEEPRPVARRQWRVWLPILTFAVALLSVWTPTPTNRSKGGPDLGFYALSGEQLQPGVQGAAYRPGDRLQFSYRADGLDSLVLLSIDGAGKLSVYYPQSGDEPYPVRPDGQHILEGSIRLDQTLGPEVFVAVFGPSSVEEARSLVLEAYTEGGYEAVVELGREDGAVDTVRILKVKP